MARKQSIPAAPAPAPAAPIRVFTVEDAHRKCLAEFDRKRVDSLAIAQREVERHIERLQRCLDLLRHGTVPYITDCSIDDRVITEACTEARSAEKAAESLRGWITCVTA